MSDLSIGISGIEVAQKGLEIIGNNMANAATEGYHRQRVELSPYGGSESVVGGVEITGITRLYDKLLELEILRQESLFGEISKEITTLRTIENSLGELSSEGSGLNAAIDKFFNSLNELSAHPSEIIWQEQVISDAESMSNQFRTLGDYLTTLEAQIMLEAADVVEQINSLSIQVAELNTSIRNGQIAGGDTNNLLDQRDQYISELSELIKIETIARDYGVVDVNISGIPIVMGSSYIELETGLDDNSKLGITIKDEANYFTDLEGGGLGGLLSLKNSIINDIHNDIDSLAGAIVQQINDYHVQGVGSEGSFTQLTGWTNSSEDLSDFSSVSAGYMYIRVTDTNADTITRTAIPVNQDASSDTLTEIAQYITTNVTGVTSSVTTSNNKLTIMAATNYEFDFIPAVLSSPTSSTLTGASPPTITISGIYTGTTNQTFTCTVSGTDSVGNGTIQITVKDGGGSTVATVKVGSGYAAGDEIDIGNGLKISLSTGDLVDAADSFTIAAYADTDTSGLLSAVGINTFFSGSVASDIAVCSDISATPGRIATSIFPEMTDNTNATSVTNL